MRHGGHAPEEHRQSISHARSHTIDEAPYHQHANGVSRLKHKHQIAVIDFVPSEVVLQSYFQDAQNLAIHVVFADSHEKHRADDPAELARKDCGARVRMIVSGHWRATPFRFFGDLGYSRILHQVAICDVLIDAAGQKSSVHLH